LRGKKKEEELDKVDIFMMGLPNMREKRAERLKVKERTSIELLNQTLLPYNKRELTIFEFFFVEVFS